MSSTKYFLYLKRIISFLFIIVFEFILVKSPAESLNGNSLEDNLKSLNLDTSPTSIHQTSSRVGDSGYMSIQGLPCTTFTENHLQEVSSQIAETETCETQSIVTESDYDVQSDIFNKNINKSLLYDPKLSMYETNRNFYEKKIDLHDPKTYTKEELNGPNSVKLYQTQLKSNIIEESTMSVVSSMWEEDRDLLNNSGSDWEVPSTQILEQLSSSGSKGSHRNEVQLRSVLFKDFENFFNLHSL